MDITRKNFQLAPTINQGLVAVTRHTRTQSRPRLFLPVPSTPICQTNSLIRCPVGKRAARPAHPKASPTSSIGHVNAGRGTGRAAALRLPLLKLWLNLAATAAFHARRVNLSSSPTLELAMPAKGQRQHRRCAPRCARRHADHRVMFCLRERLFACRSECPTQGLA